MMSLNTAMEAIAYQGRSTDFTVALSNQFAGCIMSYSGKDYLDVKRRLEEISDIVFKATGIKTSLSMREPGVVERVLLNPYTVSVELPSEASFNPLQPKAMEQFIKNVPDNFQPESLLNGQIDYKKCRVSGFFSQITFNIDFSSAVFDGHLQDEDLTNILLHEVGHAWDYMVMIGQTVVTSALCAGVADHFNRYDDTDKNIQIGKIVTKQASGLEVSDEQARDPQEVIALVLEGSQYRLNKVTGKDLSPVTVSEMMADHFVTQWGRGASHVKTLAKLQHRSTLAGKLGLSSRWVGVIGTATYLYSMPWKSYLNPNVILMPLKFQFLLSGVTVGMYAIGMTLASLTGEWMQSKLNPHGSHPTLQRRIEVIRRQHVALLQERKLPNKERVAILADLDAIDQTYKEVKEWRVVLRDGFKELARKITGRAKREAILDSTSERQHNRLYELAARLENLR